MDRNYIHRSRLKIKIVLSFINPINWYYLMKRFFIRRIMSQKFLRYYDCNFNKLYIQIMIQYVEKEGNGHIKRFIKKHDLAYVLKKLCPSNDIELNKLGIDLSEIGISGENVNFKNFLNIRNEYYNQFYKEAESEINRLISFILSAIILGVVNGFCSNYFKILLHAN
ncbi:hypothetical protein [Clostridium sp.]|uniref:hypothetical protein n=1 Tax=Clostridium sp. TaxID=1506 RepID=UPI002845A77D|nr:hypothetical protein [Clostridium sp.]MDR3597054.1 hypothetical protein [Clostridium sp.]